MCFDKSVCVCVCVCACACVRVCACARVRVCARARARAVLQPGNIPGPQGSRPRKAASLEKWDEGVDINGIIMTLKGRISKIQMKSYEKKLTILKKTVAEMLK